VVVMGVSVLEEGPDLRSPPYRAQQSRKVGDHISPRRLSGGEKRA
jgi:hypothetical protein